MAKSKKKTTKKAVNTKKLIEDIYSVYYDLYTDMNMIKRAIIDSSYSLYSDFYLDGDVHLDADTKAILMSIVEDHERYTTDLVKIIDKLRSEK